MFQAAIFNSSTGYADALLRLNKSRILRSADFQSFTECNSLEDLRSFISSLSSDYSEILENIPKLIPFAFYSSCMQLISNEISYFSQHSSSASLCQFILYFRVPYMIDNASLLLRYALNHNTSASVMQNSAAVQLEREDDASADGILSKCHPLGMFDSLYVLKGPESVHQEVYYEILFQSPLGKYLVDESELQDLYSYCKQYLSDLSQQAMLQYVRLECDLRILNISINSLQSQRISIEDKLRMYPAESSSFSAQCLEQLASASSFEEVKTIVIKEVPSYTEIFNEDVVMDTWFIKKELQALEMIFVDTFTHATFFAYFRLKEQEVKNIYWIAECIYQKQPKEIFMKQVIC